MEKTNPPFSSICALNLDPNCKSNFSPISTKLIMMHWSPKSPTFSQIWPVLSTMTKSAIFLKVRNGESWWTTSSTSIRPIKSSKWMPHWGCWKTWLIKPKKSSNFSPINSKISFKLDSKIKINPLKLQPQNCYSLSPYNLNPPYPKISNTFSIKFFFSLIH